MNTLEEKKEPLQADDAAAHGMREKLLNAAEALFAEQGYDSVSVSDIARDTGTTKGHLYYYFKNKEALFDAVLERHLAAQRAAIISAVGTGGDIASRVHAALDAYIDFIERNPGFPKLIQREMCSRSMNTEKIARGMSPVHSWGEAIFSGVLPATGPASARHFFFSIYSMALNYYTYTPMLEGLWGADPMSAEALAERRAHLHGMIDMILKSLVK